MLNKRICSLEKRLRSQPSAPPLAKPLPSLPEFMAKLHAKMRGWDAESARRGLLPLEEQLDLLRMDHRTRLEARAIRDAGTAVAFPELDAIHDRAFKLCESALERRTLERTRGSESDERLVIPVATDA